MLSQTSFIFPQSCYVCFVFLFNTLHVIYIYMHIYIYICNIYIYISKIRHLYNWIVHIYTYIYNWIVHIYTYTIHYVYAYKYGQYVLSEKRDRQHLLRAKLKLAKYPTSTTNYVLLLSLNYSQSWLICLVSFMSMSRRKPPVLFKSLAQAR